MSPNSHEGDCNAPHRTPGRADANMGKIGKGWNCCNGYRDQICINLPKPVRQEFLFGLTNGLQDLRTKPENTRKEVYF